MNEMTDLSIKKHYEESPTVYKSNKLIEARYNLSATEQKLVLYAACKVDSFTGEHFNILKITTSEFYKTLGVDENSKNHTYIKELARGLMKKQLEIESEDGTWEAIQWLERSKYIPKKGIIEFQFSQAMKPFLLLLEGKYKGYPLKEVMQLDSKYSIRLYELLIQWEYTSHKSLIISVEELRKKMGLTNEHERFDNFEKSVVKIAVNELNKRSNIKVSYEKIKKGRKIEDIKFKFSVNEKAYEKELKELRSLMDAGLANHIKEVRQELSQEEKLTFNDLQLDKAYNIAFNSLVKYDNISHYLNDAVLCYIKYYYDYTLDKANSGAFNYFIKALKDDYHNISVFFKMGQKPESIKYKKE